MALVLSATTQHLSFYCAATPALFCEGRSLLSAKLFKALPTAMNAGLTSCH